MTKLSIEDKNKIINLRNQGLPVKQIISEYYQNITRQTVSSVLKKAKEMEEYDDDSKSYVSNVGYQSESESVTSLDTVVSSYLPTYTAKIVNKLQKPLEPPSNIRIPPVKPEAIDADIEGMLKSLNNQQQPIQQQPIFDNYQPIQQNIQQPIRESPQRLQTLTKIDLYLSKFQHKLVNITGDNLTMFKERIKLYSDIELESLLETFRSQISNSGLQSGIHQIFYTGTSVVEKVACGYGLKLQGYANNLSKNNSDNMYHSIASYETLNELKKQNVINFTLVYKRINKKNNCIESKRKFVAIVRKI